MNTQLFGMKVVVHTAYTLRCPELPKEILPDLAWPEGFWEEHEAWRQANFSKQYMLADTVIMHAPVENILYMNPNTWVILKRAKL